MGCVLQGGVEIRRALLSVSRAAISMSHLKLVTTAPDYTIISLSRRNSPCSFRSVSQTPAWRAGLIRKYMGNRCIAAVLKLDSEFAFSLDFIILSERHGAPSSPLMHTRVHAPSRGLVHGTTVHGRVEPDFAQPCLPMPSAYTRVCTGAHGRVRTTSHLQRKLSRALVGHGAQTLQTHVRRCATHGPANL